MVKICAGQPYFTDWNLKIDPISDYSKNTSYYQHENHLERTDGDRHSHVLVYHHLLQIATFWELRHLHSLWCTKKSSPLPFMKSLMIIVQVLNKNHPGKSSRLSQWTLSRFRRTPFSLRNRGSGAEIRIFNMNTVIKPWLVGFLR